jgi:hypothetical protein
MNFNHLMGDGSLKRKCKKGLGECYWVPVGNIRSTHGDNVHMTMFCRHCLLREDIFLSKQDYEVQERMILKEIQDVHAR